MEGRCRICHAGNLPFEEAVEGFLGTSEFQISYGLSDGEIYHFGDSGLSGPALKPGDVITMTADLDAGTVAFAVNGVACKPVKTKVQVPLFMAVNMRITDSEVSILGN